MATGGGMKAIIAAMLFFVSFARTLPPYIALAGALAIVVLAREIGWALPASIRRSAAFIGATLVVLSVVVIAGTSNFAGLVLGAIAFAWVASDWWVTMTSACAGTWPTGE